VTDKWEYLVKEIRTVDAGGTAQIINKLAEDRWELVAVSPPLHYFKRAKEHTPQRQQDERYGAREA
jgi:hypothetical protein